MGFLNPILLLAGVAVAVPIILHLFQRHESRRISFPALRYLLLTEKDHARRIRFRQLLLLVLRTALVLLFAFAAARPFLRGEGDAHPPTALAIVIDNSLSSGRVIGGERLLDVLKRRAVTTLDAATPEDRVWIVRAGEPWDVSTPGDPDEARSRVAATEISAAGGDLPTAVRQAAALVQQAGLPAAEVQVLSDLQATAFSAAGASPPPTVPVLVFHPGDAPPINRYLGSLLIGGGLPPVAGRRTDLTAGIGGDTAEAPLRLVVDDRIRGATRVPPGTAAALPFGPFPEGWAAGYVETDPDALGGDDRRWFVLAVKPPPSVAIRGPVPFFLDQAVGVLADGGRIQRTTGAADVVLAVGGDGASAVRNGSTVVVIPPTDPGLLPGLNRQLAEAGIPWRYEALAGQGQARIGEHKLPLALDDVRVTTSYRLVGEGSTGGAEVFARLEDGSPWLVRGRTGPGAYRLVGSAIDAAATNLPVSAYMVPLLEWLVSTAGSQSGARAIEAGTPLSLPSAATEIETPDGTRHPVDASLDFRPTREAGIYRVLDGDSVIDALAVNPPVRESLLDPVETVVVTQAFGADVRIFTDSTQWAGSVFSSRQGDELGRLLIALALILLVVESFVAASGAHKTARWDARPAEGEPTREMTATG